MAWHHEQLRMIRWDLYREDLVGLKDMDLDAWAYRKRHELHANCEWVMGTLDFAPGLGHITTFEAEGYEKAAELGDFDYLRRYTPIARKHGIRVFSYLNLHWYSHEFAQKNPDWQQIMSDGRIYGEVHPLYGSGTTFCINSPWRDWAFGLIEAAMRTGIDGVFLDGPVVYPDCCTCPYCRERFRERTGEEIPGEQWNAPLWHEFLSFREDSMARFLEEGRARVRGVRADGILFCNAGTWTPGGWRVARNAERLAPHQDISGAEEFFHLGLPQYETFASAMVGKYLRATGNAPVVFTHHMNGVWHYQFLPPAEMQLAVAQSIAVGASPWAAFTQVNVKHDVSGLASLGEAYGISDGHEELWRDARPVREIGLMVSARTGRAYCSRLVRAAAGENSERDLVFSTTDYADVEAERERKALSDQLSEQSLRGSYRALHRAHLCTDIVLDNALEHGEDLPPMLVLPNSACLSDRQVERLQAWVEAGGHAVLSFETGWYDEYGKPAAARMLDWLGLQFVGLLPPMTGENFICATRRIGDFAAKRLAERPPLALMVKAGEEAEIPAYYTEPVEQTYVAFRKLSEWPAVLRLRRGRGSVTFFPCSIEALLGQMTPFYLEEFYLNVILEILGRPLIETDAPPSVMMEFYEKPGVRLLHLVNGTGDMQRPVTRRIPVGPISLAITGDAPPRAVHLPLRGKELDFTFRDGRIHCELETLDLYEILAIEA